MRRHFTVDVTFKKTVTVATMMRASSELFMHAREADSRNLTFKIEDDLGRARESFIFTTYDAAEEFRTRVTAYAKRHDWEIIKEVRS